MKPNPTEGTMTERAPCFAGRPSALSRYPISIITLAAILLLAAASPAIAQRALGDAGPGARGWVEPHETILVSRASGVDGAKGNEHSRQSSVSADGRFVAFQSSATNLHPDDTDGVDDVFVRDLLTYETILVSRADGADGATGNALSYRPSISADGRFVAFQSLATNLHPDDTDGVFDVFVRDLLTQETILISRASGADGVKGDGFSGAPSVSADGRYVAFISFAANLHPDDTDGSPDVVVRDLQTHETILVSRATGADGDKGNGESSSPRISGDGRFVAYQSDATNLHPDDLDSTTDIFVRDLQTHETILVSRADGADGDKGDGRSYDPSISFNGSAVTFASAATNLHPDDTDGTQDVFVRDLVTHETTLASRATGADGDKGNSFSAKPAISGDGRFVTFYSAALNLHPDDVDTIWDVYVRDLETHQTILVSRASGADGAKGDGDSEVSSISADGRFVTFLSLALNLHPDDTDLERDVYLRDVLGPLTEAELTFDPLSLDFGEVEVGTSSPPLTATLRNIGGSEVTGLAFDIPDNGFDADTGDCGATLPAGETCAIVVTFTPPDFGPFTAALTATSDQDASAGLDLAGDGVGSPEADLSFDPSSLDFGDVEVGDTGPSLSATLQNTGTGAASGLTFFTLPNAFTADTSACGTSLGAGQSCAVVVTFTSLAPGAVAAELQVQSVEGTSAVLALTGNGLEPPPGPDLAFTPESFDFGGVSVGATSAPLTATLENAGAGDATGLTFTTPSNGFAADTGNCGATLPAGQSCSVTVTFTPGMLGGSAASLEVESAEGATATLGAQSPPEQYLYYRTFNGGDATFRMDPVADVRSARAVSMQPRRPLSGGDGGRSAIDAQSCSHYWAASDDSPPFNYRLMRANLDGTGEEVLLNLVAGVSDIELDVDSDRLYYYIGDEIFGGDIGPAGLTNVELLAVIPGQQGSPVANVLELDLAAGRLYATGRSSGIWSANLDGSDLQLVVDTSGEPMPRGLALDLQAGTIYWGDGDRPAGADTVRIHRANLDGSQHEVVLHAPSGSALVRDIAVDPDAGKLFWRGPTGVNNYRANLDGSDITQLIGIGAGGFNFVPGNIDALCGPPPADICPEGAACDRVETIYWNFGNSGGGELWRARADGSYREMLHEWDAGQPLGLAVSRELGKVYWTQTGDPECPPNECGYVPVFRANLDGTDVELVLELPFTPMSGQYPLGIDLDVATGKMFVVQRNRNGFAPDIDSTKATLWRADLDGGGLEVRIVFDDIELGGVDGPRLDREERLGYVTVNDTIHRFDLDRDGASEVVVPSLPQDLYPEGGPWELHGSAHALELDLLRGKLYWRQMFDVVTGPTNPHGRSLQADLDGTNVQVLPWPDDSSIQIQNRTALAIDAYSRRMYGVGIARGFENRTGISRWDVNDGDDLFLVPSGSLSQPSTQAIALLPAASGGAWATLSLTGMGTVPGLSATPDPLDFGAVPVGGLSAPESVTLTSTGTEPVEVTGISAASGPFERTGGDCPATPFELAPGSACTLDYSFAPTALGAFELTLTVDSTADPVTFTLAGEGVPVPPTIDVNPDSLAATLETGDTDTRPLTVANLGEETLEWAVTDGNAVAGRILRPSGRVTLPETLVAPAIVEGLVSATAAESGESAVAHPFPAVRGDQATLTHSASLDVQTPNTVACGPTGTGTTSANQFLRTFTLADFDITGDFDVTEVIFGVENLGNVPSASITVNLYTLDGSFIYDNLTLIGSAVEELTPQQQTLVTVPITGTAPAGSTLVVEIAVPDLAGVGAFFPGSNNLGETAPSYLASTDCGLPEPTPYAQVGGGFPSVHLVMTVTGTSEPPVDCTLPGWIGADPTAGSTPGGGEQTVDVTFDAFGLEPGDYAANLCFASNDPANSLVAVPLTLSVLERAHGIAVTPTMHDFGAMPVGDSAAPVTITIESTGTGDLQVDSIGEPGSAFARAGGSCEPAPFTLASGASCTLEYGFTPPSEGTFTGIATIASNADPAVIGVALTGEGEGEPPDELFRDSFEDDAP